MTDAEAKERAERIVCLVQSVPPDTNFYGFLNKEIARELQRVATECGWQKNKLKDIQDLVDKQAEDEGLWGIPEFGMQSISEAYFQQELRKLHEVIEKP